MREPAQINPRPQKKHAHELCMEIAEDILVAVGNGKKHFTCVLPSIHFKQQLSHRLLSALRQKTIIISPHTASQTHWIEDDSVPRLDELAAQLWGNATGHLVSTLPFSCAPLLVLTAASVSLPDEAERNRLCRHLMKYGYRLVILDHAQNCPTALRRTIQALQDGIDAIVLEIHDTLIGRDDLQEPDHLFPEGMIIRDGYMLPNQYLAFVAPPTNPEIMTSPLDDSAKLHGMANILQREQSLLRDALRAVVCVEDTGIPDEREPVARSSAVQGLSAFHILAAHAHGSKLHPLLLTGSSLLCSANRATALLGEARSFLTNSGWDVTLTESRHDDISELFGSGRDWNSKTYRNLCLHLFTRGLSHCLIAPSDLLESGWERCQSNVVIDLTRTPFLFFPNQLKRPFHSGIPQHGLICHHWDVIVVQPGQAVGLDDYQRVSTKHTHIAAPVEGEMEYGPGHIHPALRTAPIRTDPSKVTSDHLHEAAFRDRALRKWEIGQGMTGKREVAVELQPLSVFPKYVFFDGIQKQLLGSELERYRERVHSQQLHYTYVTTVAVGGVLSCMLFLPNLLGITVGTTIFVLLAGYVLQHWIRTRYMKPSGRGLTPVDCLKHVSRAVLAAGGYEDLHVRVQQCSDGTLRAVLGGAPPHVTEPLAQAIADAFQPVHSQASFAHTFRLDYGTRTLRELVSNSTMDAFVKAGMLIPVPEMFSSSHEETERFCSALRSHFGRTEILQAANANAAQYIRNVEGKQLLQCEALIIHIAT